MPEWKIGIARGGQEYVVNQVYRDENNWRLTHFIFCEIAAHYISNRHIRVSTYFSIKPVARLNGVKLRRSERLSIGTS